MSRKVQNRRTFSVTAATYAAVRSRCFAAGESMSAYVERLIAEDRKHWPAPLTANPRTENLVSKAVAGTGRTVKGRGNYQRVMAEVRHVAERIPLAVGKDAVHRIMHGAAVAAIKRREAGKVKVEIKEGAKVGTFTGEAGAGRKVAVSRDEVKW